MPWEVAREPPSRVTLTVQRNEIQRENTRLTFTILLIYNDSNYCSQIVSFQIRNQKIIK